jgi:hypothetical protein
MTHVLEVIGIVFAVWFVTGLVVALLAGRYLGRTAGGVTELEGRTTAVAANESHQSNADPVPGASGSATFLARDQQGDPSGSVTPHPWSATTDRPISPEAQRIISAARAEAIRRAHN